MAALWHRTVNAAWKWTGMRAWNRKLRAMLQRAHGGRVVPRKHGDDIPVMLSPGCPAEEIVEHYGEDLGLRLNERRET